MGYTAYYIYKVYLPKAGLKIGLIQGIMGPDVKIKMLINQPVIKKFIKNAKKIKKVLTSWWR